jgi:hypothetical protein
LYALGLGSMAFIKGKFRQQQGKVSQMAQWVYVPRLTILPSNLDNLIMTDLYSHYGKKKL